MHCAGCGYPSQYHEIGTQKCPKETETSNGRRGKWRDPPPIDRTDFRGIMRRDWLARQAVYEAAHTPYVPVVVPPPRVPARPPRSALEIAGYQGRQAVGLGRRATAAGWLVEAAYAVRHDGEEFCAVRMQRGDLYAVATWTRPANKAGTNSGWGGDIAYGVKRGDMPVKLTHTQLEGVITT